MSRTIYLLREALVNLRRNALVVAGAVLAVFVSLTLAFGALVVNEMVRVTTLQWKDGVHVIVFLKDTDEGISQAAQLNLLTEVQSWNDVSTATFFDKQEAWEEFKVMFADQPAIVEEMDPTVLPPSIRIKLNDIEQYRAVQYLLADQPAVERVVSPGENIDQLATLSRVLNVLGLGLAVVLGGSAVIMISNTIRMAIYARRDEVAIMKLVGAGNWFIRIPFLLEGMLEGLIGAALAVAAVWLAQNSLGDVDNVIQIFSFSVDRTFLLQWGVAFLMFGAAAGVMGSALGLRRFLKV